MAASTLDTSGAVALSRHYWRETPQGRVGLPVRHTTWSDLDPFTQGYVEALFASLVEAARKAMPARSGDCPTIRVKRLTISSLNIMSGDHGPERVEWRVEPCGRPLFGKDREAGVCGSCAKSWAIEGNRPLAFHHLAPETLTRIMEDCEAARRQPYPGGPYTRGDWFWDDRQAGRLARTFPPLAPYLGDDGKVYLREAA